MARSMEGCLMLALSRSGNSEQAVQNAIRKAKLIGKLLVLFVADVNIARHFISAGHGSSRGSEQTCEADLLKLHEKEGRERVEQIAAQARMEHIETKTIVGIGAFSLICRDVIRQEKPSLITTIR